MSERPRHGHEASHFGDLLSSRIVSEVLTNFDADTPLETILQWLHARLSLMEEGKHIVTGFSADSVRFQPTFTIDAIRGETFTPSFLMDARFPITPTDPEFIPANAWFTGAETIDAWVKGERPNQYYHYDTFSNEQLHGWGWADTIGHYDIVQNLPDSSSTQNFEWGMYKADVDPTPPSEDPEGEPSNDFRGRVYEDLPWPHGSYPQLFGEIHLQDKGVANKRIKMLARFGNSTTASANDAHVRLYFRGGNNYIKRGTVVSTSSTEIVVDGVSSGNLGSSNGWYWHKIEAFDRFVRYKFWPKDTTEPSTWNYEVDTATATPNETYLDFNMSYGGIIVPELAGSPWTHEFKHLSVEGINTGPIPANAYLRPAPFPASAWLSSGDDFYVDAFIEPTFRANALIVEYVPGNFTIGSFKEDRVEQGFGADAHIGGYARLDAVIASDAVYGSHTADAWKVVTTEDSITEDSVVKDIGREYSVIGDAISKVLGTEGTFGLDAYKNLLIEGSHTIDAFFNPGAHPPADAVIKDPDRPGTFTSGAWLWPEGVELFVVNAAKTDSFSQSLTTADAAIDAEYANQDPPHWDDFNRPAIANSTGKGWGTPRSGSYTYSGGSPSNQYYLPTPTAGGENVGAMYENLQHVVVYAREPKSIDRTVSCDIRMNPLGYSISWGNYYFGICGNLRLSKDHRYAEWELQCYYGGAWNVIYTVNPGGDPNWQSFKVKVTGQRIQCKIWIRSNGEPATWDYDGTPDWTPTSGQPFINPDTTRWFTSGSIPTTQYFDNWFVDGAGYPFDGTADAVIKDIDREYGHTADSYFVPEPFSMDAFIQPHFSANARIWLGTTFPADSIKQETQVFGGNELVPGGSVGTNGGSTFWQYNSSAAPIAAEQARVSGGTVNSQGSIKSKETFGPSSGNAFPSVTNRVWTFYHSASPRDILRFGLYDATLGTGHNYTGFYGFRVNDYGDGVYDLINGVEGGSQSWTDSISSITKFEVEYLDVGGGNSQMKLYVGGVLRRTSATFATPTWASFRMGFHTAYGIVTGSDWIWYTPTIGSWRDPGYADAWIVSGAHIPFSAQLTGKNMNAILKVPDNPGSFWADAVKFITGEQLKSFTSDAWAAAFVNELYKTQFGDLELGRLMWGDVTPEREQLHYILQSFLAGRLDINAIIDKGHAKLFADIMWDDRLFHFYDADEEKPDRERKAENLRLWMWERFG